MKVEIFADGGYSVQIAVMPWADERSAIMVYKRLEMRAAPEQRWMPANVNWFGSGTASPADAETMAAALLRAAAIARRLDAGASAAEAVVVTNVMAEVNRRLDADGWPPEPQP